MFCDRFVGQWNIDNLLTSQNVFLDKYEFLLQNCCDPFSVHTKLIKSSLNTLDIPKAERINCLTIGTVLLYGSWVKDVSRTSSLFVCLQLYVDLCKDVTTPQNSNFMKSKGPADPLLGLKVRISLGCHHHISPWKSATETSHQYKLC